MTNPGEAPQVSEDVQRAVEEVSQRLDDLGIWLDGDERPQDLVEILEAVEQFELAVRTRGGDLMVDEGPDGRTTQPDDEHFALPRRNADETVERFLDRLERARRQVLEHPARE